MENIVITIKDVLSLFDDIKKELATELRQRNINKKRVIIFYDLLKRIKSNIYTISIIEDSGKNLLAPKNLLYRNVLSDLIEGLYLLSRDTEQFEKGIQSLDLAHAKFIKDALIIRTELYKKVSHKDENEKLQVFMNEYYDKVQCYLTSPKGAEWEFIRMSGSFSIRDMSNALKNDSNESLKQFYFLYHYYRLFSQTEHYTLLGREYSFFLNENIYSEVLAIIYCGMNEMSKLIINENAEH
jgi:hypothetical protein